MTNAIKTRLRAEGWEVAQQDRRSTVYNHADRAFTVQVMAGGEWALLDAAYNDIAAGNTAASFTRAFNRANKKAAA